MYTYVLFCIFFLLDQDNDFDIFTALQILKITTLRVRHVNLSFRRENVKQRIHGVRTLRLKTVIIKAGISTSYFFLVFQKHRFINKKLYFRCYILHFLTSLYFKINFLFMISWYILYTIISFLAFFTLCSYSESKLLRLTKEFWHEPERECFFFLYLLFIIKLQEGNYSI